MNLDTFTFLFCNAMLRASTDGYGRQEVLRVEPLYWLPDGMTEECCGVQMVLEPRVGEAPRSFMVIDERVPASTRAQLAENAGFLVTETIYLPPGQERRKHG